MDNGKIAILGHFPAPNFDRNSTPIVALYQSSHARGLAFAKLLNVLLGHVFFCRDVGLADMNPEELLSRVAKQFTRLGIHQSKIAAHIKSHNGVRSLLHQEPILMFTLL